MAYKLMIPEHTTGQIGRCIDYVVHVLHNFEAASAILDEINEVYAILKMAPEAFSYCQDPCLQAKRYRKVPLKRHRYVFIYRIEEDKVYLLGFFHMMENYAKKL